MSDIFLALFLLSLVGLVAVLIKPSVFKVGSRGRGAAIFGGVAVAFLVLFGVTTPSKSGGNQADTATPSPTQAVSSEVSPDQLPLWLSIALTTLSKSSTLSSTQASEISKIPSLLIQDKWNEELGYYENLAPETATPLTNFQVEAILGEIQSLRKDHGDKWFDVMIFDDPAIAKLARTADLTKLSDAQYCNVFAHFRGTYSWNPTNQNESVLLGMNCDWQSLSK